MKGKSLLLLLAMGTSPVFAQEKSSTESKIVKTESNGIQVYEALGNNNSNSIVVESPVERSERTLNDWNLEECENALYFVDLKIEQTKEEEGELDLEQVKHYEIQKQAIIDRIQLLSNTTK